MLKYLCRLVIGKEKNKQVALTALLLMWLMMPFNGLAEDPQENQYFELSKKDKLIAAYLFNFTKFIDWPEFSRREARNQITLCMREDARILDFTRELVADREVGPKKLKVEVRVLKDTVRCDMAWFERRGLPLPENLQEVLIVTSDLAVFPGVAAISFYEDKKRLRFEINMNEINSLKLTVRSELLKLARLK